MIIGGGSRRCAKWWATHLARTDGGQSVRFAEVRGLAGNDIPFWFRQMEAVALGTRAENYFYHAHIDPREDESLTEPQWEEAIDKLEDNLGLTGHSRFVIEHEKEGRTHRHVFWSRIDPDTMKAVSDSKTYRIHERTADELEKAFGHEPTLRSRDKESRNPHNYEVHRGQETGIAPKDVNVDVRALWNQADSAPAFAAALEEHGFILAEGRRGLCVVDPAGDEHSLYRRLGLKKKEVDPRMEALREGLPSVAEAKATLKERAADRGRDAPDAPLPELAPNPGPETGGPAGPRLTPHRPEPTPFEQAAAHLLQRETIPAQPGAFDHRIAQWQLAYREAVGDGSFIADGIDWLTQKLLRPPVEAAADHEATAIDGLAEAMVQAARDNGGEPPSADGHSFWQRAVASIAGARDRVASWAKETFHSFTERLLRERKPDAPKREPEIER